VGTEKTKRLFLPAAKPGFSLSGGFGVVPPRISDEGSLALRGRGSLDYREAIGENWGHTGLLPEGTMPRGEQLIRQWNLLKTLQSRRFGIGLDELTEELGCSRRTVQRDLSVLCQAGFPVEHETRDFGRRVWKVSRDFLRTGELILSVTEMVSLYLSRQLLAPLSGTAFGDGLASAIEKIKALLPEDALRHFEGLDETLLVKTIPRHDYSAHDTEIRVLNTAIAECRVAVVRYHSAHSDTTHHWHCHPYGLVLYGTGLYCIAYVVECEAVRVMKIERLHGVRATDERFRRPPDFSLQEFLVGSFGVYSPGRPVRVVVRFTGWAGRNVLEVQWHPSQRIAEKQPEAVVVEFTLRETTEFKRWVLGFGRHAVVLRPAWLASEVAEEHSQAAGNYGPLFAAEGARGPLKRAFGAPRQPVTP